MTERTGGDVVVDVLARSGVEVIFGIPSVHNLRSTTRSGVTAGSARSASATSRALLARPTGSRGRPAGSEFA